MVINPKSCCHNHRSLLQCWYGMTFEHWTSLSWYWVSFLILIPVWSSVFGTFGSFSYQSGLDIWSKTDLWLVWMRQVYPWYLNSYKTGTRLVLPQVIQILVGSLPPVLRPGACLYTRPRDLFSDNCSHTGTYLSHTLKVWSAPNRPNGNNFHYLN